MLATIKHIAGKIFLRKQHIMALCMQHSPTAAAKLSLLLLTSYASNNAVITKCWDLYCSMSVSCESINRTEKTSSYWQQSW